MGRWSPAGVSGGLGRSRGEVCLAGASARRGQVQGLRASPRAHNGRLLRTTERTVRERIPQLISNPRTVLYGLPKTSNRPYPLQPGRVEGVRGELCGRGLVGRTQLDGARWPHNGCCWPVSMVALSMTEPSLTANRLSIGVLGFTLGLRESCLGFRWGVLVASTPQRDHTATRFP